MGCSSNSSRASRQSSLASTYKSDVLASTKDNSSPSRVVRANSMMSELPPSYEAVISSTSSSPAYGAPAGPSSPPQLQGQYFEPMVDMSEKPHTCLKQDPMRYVPLAGLVKVALFPLSIPYCALSRDTQCRQCGAGIGRQLTGMAIGAAKRKIAEKQAKRAAKQ